MTSSSIGRDQCTYPQRLINSFVNGRADLPVPIETKKYFLFSPGSIECISDKAAIDGLLANTPPSTRQAGLLPLDLEWAQDKTRLVMRMRQEPHLLSENQIHSAALLIDF